MKGHEGGGMVLGCAETGPATRAGAVDRHTSLERR
jgi:hypothetical protein